MNFFVLGFFFVFGKDSLIGKIVVSKTIDVGSSPTLSECFIKKVFIIFLFMKEVSKLNMQIVCGDPKAATALAPTLGQYKIPLMKFNAKLVEFFQDKSNQYEDGIPLNIKVIVFENGDFIIKNKGVSLEFLFEIFCTHYGIQNKEVSINLLYNFVLLVASYRGLSLDQAKNQVFSYFSSFKDKVLIVTNK